MTTLTVGAQGQVTLCKTVLQHFGIKQGEKIALDFLPDGRVALKAARRHETIAGDVGSLARQANKVGTHDAISPATKND